VLIGGGQDFAEGTLCPLEGRGGFPGVDGLDGDLVGEGEGGVYGSREPTPMERILPAAGWEATRSLLHPPQSLLL